MTKITQNDVTIISMLGELVGDVGKVFRRPLSPPMRGRRAEDVRSGD